MQRYEVRLSDELALRLDAKAAAHGGRAEAVEALLRRALQEDDAAAAGPAEDGRGRIALRFTAAEVKLIDRQLAVTGLTHGEWLLSCIRRQLSWTRQLGRVDRTYLRKAMLELKALHEELNRVRAAVHQAGASGADLRTALRPIEALRSRLTDVGEAIHQGFLGDDRYWERLRSEPPASGPKSRPSPTPTRRKPAGASERRAAL